MVTLITGALGSVGQALVERIPGAITTDIDTMDVRKGYDVRVAFERYQPDLIYHLAGAKHAPEGELDPASVTKTNVQGTHLVCVHAANHGARVVLASTCKAADPATVYGASKLIAERIVLNADGVVCRFYNIPDAQGNVFRYWESLPEDEPLPVTDCWRYFITMEQALDLLIAAADFPTGRYAADPGQARYIPALANELYPDRQQVRIPRRRGDRFAEPLAADCETRTGYHDHGVRFLRITNPHDPVPLLQEAA